MNVVGYKEQFVDTGQEHQLVDVRRPDEYEVGHLIGAVNIPLQEIGNRLAEFSLAMPIVVYCRTGNRSGKAAELLAENGYGNVLNAGSLAELAKLGLLVEP